MLYKNIYSISKERTLNNTSVIIEGRHREGLAMHKYTNQHIKLDTSKRYLGMKSK